MLRFVLSAVFSCLMLGTASAATITSETPVLADLQSNSLDLPAGSHWLIDGGYTAPDIEQGSSDGLYRSPYDGLGTGNYETIAYWNISGPENYLVFDRVMNSLSFLWGSPDSYNYVTLINTAIGGPNLVVQLADLISPVTPPVGGGASFVTIRGFAFNKVLFTSQTPAFEIGNIAAAVPLPAGGVLLLIGLGGLALLRRRSASAQI